MYTNMFEKEPGIDVRVCMIPSGVVTTNEKKNYDCKRERQELFAFWF